MDQYLYLELGHLKSTLLYRYRNLPNMCYLA